MLSCRHALALCLLGALPAEAATVTRTDLTSNTVGQAQFTDPSLVNAWGISYTPGGDFWVSDNKSGVTTLYDGTGNPQSLVVTIPSAKAGGTGSPTGQTYNPNPNEFQIAQNGKKGAATFIFVTEDGTISGWNPDVNATSAVVAVNMSDKHAMFTGAAFYTDGSDTDHLLVTDFHNGVVREFDTNFNETASYRDNFLPPDYQPFNVAVFNGNIYISYAEADNARRHIIAGRGIGDVDLVTAVGSVVFNAELGSLNAPWGMAVAPASWGALAGKLMVSDVGSGEISLFDLNNLDAAGTLKNGKKPVKIDGLWGLIPGNNGGGGSADDVYFTAGPNKGADGLFGSLSYKK